MVNNEIDVRVKTWIFVWIATLTALGIILSQNVYQRLNVHWNIGRFVSWIATNSNQDLLQAFRVGILVVICLIFWIVAITSLVKVLILDIKRLGTDRIYRLRLYLYVFTLSMALNFAYRLSWAVSIESSFGKLLH